MPKKTIDELRGEEPTYEDDRFRVWAAKQNDVKADKEMEDDPTIMSIVDGEEIYESRIYGLKPGDDIIEKAFESLVSLRKEIPKALWPSFIERLFTDLSFKVLAKQNTKTEKVSYLIVLSAERMRGLIEKGDDVTEDEYHKAIAKFEDNDWLTEPQVTTKAELYNIMEIATEEVEDGE